MGYVAKLFAQSSRLYLLSKDKGTRGERYFFLLAHPAKELALQKAVEGKIPGNIEDFGEVIASGWGRPNRETLEKMRDQYGFEQTH